MLDAKTARKKTEKTKDRMLFQLKDKDEYKNVERKIYEAIEGGYRGVEIIFKEVDEMLYFLIIEQLKLNGFICEVKRVVISFHRGNEYRLRIRW